MAKSSCDIQILNHSHSLEEWDCFVDNSPQGCIFCRSWWLKAVCPDGFEILTITKGGKIFAGMPMSMHRRFGYTGIYMPQLTQTLGVLLAPQTSSKYEKNLSTEMNVLNALVEAIPKIDSFSMNFNYNFTNWLPFYWAGYKQTTRYTYVLPDLTDLNRVFSEFAHSKRKNIKKAKDLVCVHTDLSAKDFYAHHTLTLSKQGEQVLYPFEHFKRIYDAAYKEVGGKIWYAVDKDKNIPAAIFVVFDSKSAYYLISSIDPDFRNSGAATLLIRDAIAYVSQYSKRFDFEGSMISGVENSFRKFGAIQKPFFNISKDNRPLLKKFLMVGAIKISDGIRKIKGNFDSARKIVDVGKKKHKVNH